MTMAAVPAYIGYIATAGQTVVPVPFRVFAPADLQVLRNGLVTTGYTLSGVGAATCTLTMLAPLAAGDLLHLRRVTTRQQLLDYHANDPFGAESHEAALDRSVAMVQDLLEELSRRPALSVSTVPGLRNLTFPQPGAGRLIGWDGSGTGLTTYPSTAGDVLIDAYNALNDAFTNVRQHGATGDGVTDDSAAIQAAIDLITSRGGGQLYLPPGRYRLESPLAIADTSMAVVGAGMEVTQLLVTNSTGALTFVSTGAAQSEGNAHHLRLCDLTVVAHGVGAFDRGYAVKATWPVPSLLLATPHATIERVGIRSQDYDSNPASQPHFSTGVWLQNAHDVFVQGLHILQLNMHDGTMLYLDNAHDASCFHASLQGLEILGGARGVSVTGWLENLEISEFEIVGQDIAIHCDATDSDVTNTALFISNGHANGAVQAIAITKWSDVHLANLSCYVFPLAGTLTTDTVFLQLCVDVSVVGCRLSVGPNLDATVMYLLRLVDTQKFAVTANTFVFAHDEVTALMTGVFVGPDAYLGTITGNIFYVGGEISNTQGVLVQADVPNQGELTVAHNRFENVDTCIVLVEVAEALIAHNMRFGGTTTLAFVGAPGPRCLVQDNFPRTARPTLTVNDGAPSVAAVPDGLALVSSTAATTIINFAGGTDGQTLELLATTANTTIQNNATIQLAGSVNFVMGAGDILTLRLMGTVWRELARTEA